MPVQRRRGLAVLLGGGTQWEARQPEVENYVAVLLAGEGAKAAGFCWIGPRGLADRIVTALLEVVMMELNGRGAALRDRNEPFGAGGVDLVD